MKEEELRIGNLVFDTLDKKVCTVDGIDGIYGQVATLDKKMDEYERTIKPEGVPLTEEWLVKFGFEDKHGYEYPSYRKNLLLVYGRPDKEWCFIIGKGLSSFESDARPLYVHQLQNLYYALTGEELELKPSSPTS